MAHGHKFAKLKPANHQSLAICQNLPHPLQNYQEYLSLVGIISLIVYTVGLQNGCS